MSQGSRFLTAIAFVCVAGFSHGASAQTVRGHITGVVNDEAGKTLPDVFVTSHGVEQAQLMKTDSSGEFRLHDLVAGRYVLTIARDGYTTIVHSGMMVRGGRIARLSLVMKVVPDAAPSIVETPDPFALLPVASRVPVDLIAKNTRTR